MKTKLLVIAALVLVMATAGYAQTGFNGKWATDPPAATAAPVAPPASAPAGGPGGGGGGRGGGRGGGAAPMQMELTVAGTTVAGSVTEGGATMMIREGTIDGKKAIVKTQRDLNGAPFDITWTAEMTDDSTLSVTREFPNGVPGRGGAAPGGAPAAGAPPVGAPPAAGAAPAGGAPAGGTPAGGGGGGRGGGAGGIAAVILHRAK